MTDSELLQPPKIRTYPDEVYAPLSGSNDSPSPNSSSLMSPAGLLDSASTSTTTSCGSRRRSQAGWLWAFETVSLPPAIRYWSEVAFQEAPSSARSKSSVNGASMTGTLARQAGRGASASPRNEASRAPRMPAKYPPAPSPASSVARAAQAGGQLVEEAPPDAAIADPDLGDAGRGRDSIEDQRAREDHVRAAWVETDHPLALRLRRAAQARDLTAEVGARQPVAVDARGVVARRARAPSRRAT